MESTTTSSDERRAPESEQPDAMERASLAGTLPEEDRRTDDPTAQGDGASGFPTAVAEGDYAARQVETATLPFEDPRSIAEGVTEFFDRIDEHVKAAFRAHVLSEIDALGAGGAVSIDGTTVAVSGYHAGRRSYGHGPTTAEALADFHRNAGPRH
jgi:hypothetical protein